MRSGVLPVGDDDGCTVVARRVQQRALYIS